MEKVERFNRAFQYLRSIGKIHTQKDLSIAMNANRVTISNALKDKGGYLNEELLSRLCNTFHGIFNEEWLLTGKGEMLVEDNTPKQKSTSEKQEVLERIDTTINEGPKINFSTGVPYYNVDFIGGFDLVFNDQTVNPEYLIDFKKYNDATCWCNVTGHSMEPEIHHGDMIALKKIEDISFLPLGEIYAIVTTNDMRTIKRLGAGKTDDTYTLVPSNKSPEYGIQPIPANMIRAVFQVLGAVKRF